MSVITSAPDRRESSAGPRRATRLLVVDDHAAVRAGLRELLAGEEDFDVIAAVSTAEAAVGVAVQTPVDVAVVDYQLGDHNGLWLSRKLKRLPDPPAVLIYSAYADGVLAAAAVVAECDGVVSKAELGASLCAAIRCVAHGDSCLRPTPPWLGEVLRRRFDDYDQAVFGMLLAGIAPTEISKLLGLSGAQLESRLWRMLSQLETPQAEWRPNAGMG